MAKFGNASALKQDLTPTLTAVGSIIGAVIQITAGINGGRYWQIVGGKIVICMSIGIASVSVPLYLAECSPPSIRGGLINSYVEVQAIGTFASGIVIYCIKNMVDQRVWCIPIGLQLLAPVVMLAFGWTIPESPRWLLESGRKEEARASLLHLRRGKAGYDPEEDLQVIEENYERERENGRVSWGQCFRGIDRKRTLIVLGIQCLQQGQGISFMANYLVIFLMQLGIKDVFMILVIIYAILVILTALGFWAQDFVGRRRLLIGGGCVMAASLIAVGAITTANPTPTGALANVLVFLISAELPSEATREKTLAIGAFGGYVTGMLVGLLNPYMQNAEYGNLGGKVGFVYGSVSVAAIFFCWAFLPELKGRSLEQIDYLFEAGVPLRKMGTYVFDDTVPLNTANYTQGYEPGQGGSIGDMHDKKNTEIEHVA
ncbi:hypothetical protein QFC24_004624 [Naganishia onofrii]|uniref:Uncharacterized protein n=1 Tax=Naganishia onofrii TaxID=1851511 RepID=A0ACC2XBT4_9TREE|nr:hypothetical protein QFC24_004624 [Naganishia onofrii]